MNPTPFDLATTPLAPGVTLLEASAGTGKTFALAGLYLRMVLEAGLSVPEILVVTFTEAATAELRGRIRGRLAEARRILRAGATDDPVWEALLLGGVDEDRQERLQRVTLALEQFDAAAIFTIHGFCQRVLRECAFETGALFDAELQPNTEALVQEAADNFWRRHFYEAPARHLLFAQHAGISEETLVRLLRRHLQQAQPTVLTVADGRSLAEVLKAADEALAQATALWTAHRAEITAHFGDDGGRWANTPYKSSEAMEPRFAALDALFDDRGTAMALQVMAELRPEALTGKQSKKARLPVPSHPFFEACQILGDVLALIGPVLRYALLTAAPLELIRLKDRDRVLGFDDLLGQVATALGGRHGDALTEKLRSRYGAALIDEFQDTDPLQWSIFQRLFAGGGTPLYLVGDPKQAIYSFRGADVFTYLRARETAGRCFTLGENWRSTGALVAAVNRLFSNQPRPFVAPEIEFHPVQAAGQADGTPLNEAGRSLPPLQVWFWDPEAEGVTTEPARQSRLAAAAAEEIVRLLSEQTSLGNRRLAPGDIAVLVDKHDQAEAVAQELARRRVPCVRQTQESVLATREADDLQMLLDGLSDGADEAQRRAALVTDLVGVSQAGLAMQREGDAEWESWPERLAGWREQWRRQGVLPMLETVLRAQNTRSRLLAAADGERRLTNYLHLGELLQQIATTERRAPRSLASWLADQRARALENAQGADETLLRLEGDAAAVQLVTIHRSKGLEYPVVLCPFPGRAFDQGLKTSGLHAAETVLFHDPSDDDLLKHDVGTPQFAAHQQRSAGEALAENLRLLYVALTRAQHRCQVAWTVGGEPGRRALAWLLSPPPEVESLTLEQSPEALASHVAGQTPEQLLNAVQRLTGPEITVRDLPPPGETRWVAPEVSSRLHERRVFGGRVQRDWGSASFSSLAHGLPDERDPVDDHARVAIPDRSAGVWSAFRGARAGVCLHEVFEALDFATVNEETVRTRVKERLVAGGFPPLTLTAPVAELVMRSLEAPMFEGSSLRGVSLADCWRELEFTLPLRPISPAALSAAFAAGPPGAAGTALSSSLAGLNFAEIRGVLGGFVDLVFRVGGKWWLVDWKSNWLGETPEAYGQDALKREMLGQHYGLQYHLYLLALNRLLRVRLPDYNYERDFGGVRYVFVRGVTPGRPELGVFADRPPGALLDVLERRLLEEAS